MAGIGFTLRKLTQRDDLIGILQGYAHSAVISTGPWIFTILSLGGINLIAGRLVDTEVLSLFRIVVIYNFAFSLVFTGPVLLVSTRYLADMIYQKNVEEAVGMMLACLGLTFLIAFPVVVYFYGFLTELEADVRVAAISNFFLATGIWTVSVFVSALKDYRTITLAFLVGMATAFGATVGLAEAGGTSGMLIGFNIGIAIILFTMIARVFAEYPYRIVNMFGFLGAFRKYWDLALIGFVFNAGVWVDKWIMWFAPGHETAAGYMVFFSNYDSASFLAYMTTIPTLSLFLLQVETSFFVHYKSFFSAVQNHASFGKIRELHSNIMVNMLGNLRTILILQGAITAVAILSAPKIFQLFDINFLQLGIFRFVTLGAFFHTLIQILSIALAYFDLRRMMLWVNLVFLVTNAAFTWIAMNAGIGYYGAGFMAASVVTFIFAYGLTSFQVGRLPYLVFAGNNPSVQ